MEAQIVAAFLGAFIAVFGAQAVWARWLLGKINEARRDAQEADNALHERIGEPAYRGHAARRPNDRHDCAPLRRGFLRQGTNPMKKADCIALALRLGRALFGWWRERKRR